MNIKSLTKLKLLLKNFSFSIISCFTTSCFNMERTQSYIRNLPNSNSGHRNSQDNFEDGVSSEEEWSNVSDAAESRRIQNRNAQRKYRKSRSNPKRKKI